MHRSHSPSLTLIALAFGLAALPALAWRDQPSATMKGHGTAGEIPDPPPLLQRQEVIPGWNDDETLRKLRAQELWRSDPGYYPMRFGDPTQPQICNEAIPRSTPTERFIDHGDGTVTDKLTGLMWMRCALGHSWDGTTCQGVILRTAWQGALEATQKLNNEGGYASHADWRLPNMKELNSIVEWACHSPAANLEVFPKTENIYYWSSTPSTETLGENPPRVQYWGVNFLEGRSAHHDATIRRVRLTRNP